MSCSSSTARKLCSRPQGPMNSPAATASGTGTPRERGALRRVVEVKRLLQAPSIPPAPKPPPPPLQANSVYVGQDDSNRLLGSCLNRQGSDRAAATRLVQAREQSPRFPENVTTF